MFFLCASLFGRIQRFLAGRFYGQFLAKLDSIAAEINDRPPEGTTGTALERFMAAALTTVDGDVQSLAEKLHTEVWPEVIGDPDKSNFAAADDSIEAAVDLIHDQWTTNYSGNDDDQIVQELRDLLGNGLANDYGAYPDDAQNDDIGKIVDHFTTNATT